MKLALFSLVLLVFGVTIARGIGGFDRITGRAFAGRSEVIAPHAMAATSQPLATQVALEVVPVFPWPELSVVVVPEPSSKL